MSGRPADKGARFRRLHEAAGAFIIPNPWDVGTARILAALGFEALATTSAGMAFSLGLVEGAASREQVLGHCRAIVEATPLPVSADLEKGFGDSPESAAETVVAAAAVGLAGCSIEDHTGDRGRPIYDFALAVARIAAAAQARDVLGHDFVLTARCENFLWGRPDLDDTIRRLQAFERAGGRYYPKLLSAVPFTPVPGPRLLAESDAARAVLIECLAAVSRRLGLSSLHVTFCTEPEAEALGRAGFLLRRGIQFHWENQGYRDFQGWLDALKSAKRKMVRKEREQVRAAGVGVEAVHGAALSRGLLDEFFPLYLATVDKRWGNAYLSRDFFRRLADPALRDRVVLMVARHEERHLLQLHEVVGQTA